jgi:hypothetical protein
VTVQRYPDPRLVTDSQSGGGTVHQSYGMGAPGSMPIDGMPQGFEIEDLQNVMDPAQASPGTDRNLLGPDGSPRDPADASYPHKDPVSGRFDGADDGGWSSPFSNAGGWGPA